MSLLFLPCSTGDAPEVGSQGNEYSGGTLVEFIRGRQ
jgi:hypothetical protein